MVMDKMIKMTIAGILAIVGILIAFVVLPPVIVALFPTAVAGIVTLSTLGNFTFASLFTATGMFPLMLSLVIFLLVLAVIIVAITYVVGQMKTKGR
jgi:hypothetical protein